MRLHTGRLYRAVQKDFLTDCDYNVANPPPAGETRRSIAVKNSCH